VDMRDMCAPCLTGMKFHRRAHGMAFRAVELAANLWRLAFKKRKVSMDRFAAMSVFVAAAAAGSLSAASRRLRMPLPRVSRKITELEKSLDAKLLIRGTRKLSLTEVGETYLVSCRRILEELAEAERGASGEYKAPQGELVVTAPVTLGRLHV